MSHPVGSVGCMFRDLVGAVSEALFPMACPGCGRRADPVCPSCAVLLVAPQAASPPHRVDAWAAAFAYEGVAREIVARVKYRGAHAAVKWLAARMADAAAHASIVAGVDAVTWAPTTAARRRARGFDHAELLALSAVARVRASGTVASPPDARSSANRPSRLGTTPRAGLRAASRHAGDGPPGRRRRDYGCDARRRGRGPPGRGCVARPGSHGRAHAVARVPCRCGFPRHPSRRHRRVPLVDS